ncbi:MAG: magnesium-dependent phosphatase-1 [Candidatus Bathyarchaeia archaeon]
MAEVRLVVLDCDLTLWSHPDVSALRPPFRRVDPMTVRDDEGELVRLHEGVRETLEGLRERGILVSVASWNDPEPVHQLFRLFEIGGYFIHPKVEHHPRKGEMIRELIEDLERDGVEIEAEEILYVHDKPRHLDGILRAVGRVKFKRFGVDLRRLEDILKLLS